MHHKHSVCTMALAFCAVFLNACGQNDRIEGTVKDIFDAPLGDVSVTVVNSAFKAKTESDGRFGLDYAPGRFSVKFSKEGYTTHLLDLDLHQKSRYPTEDIVLCPIPKQRGVYWVNRENRQLVALPHNYDIRVEQENTGFMETMITVRAWPSDDGTAGPMIRSGTVEFIDTDPNRLELAEVGEYNVIYKAVHSPLGIKKAHRVGPAGSIRMVGVEKMQIRTFEMRPWGYVWAQYGNNLFGQTMPVAGTKARSFTVIE